MPAAIIVHGANHVTTSKFSMIFKGMNNLEITPYKEDSGLIIFAMITGYPINGAPKNISKISFNMIMPTTSEAKANKIFTTEIENIR